MAGLKDARVSMTTRVLRLAASRSVAGIAGAVVAFNRTPPIADWFPDLILDNKIARTAAVGVTGFAAGYGCMSALHWLRRKLIKQLLGYHGWLKGPNSKRVKLWGLVLKLLIGPGPHKLLEFQSLLPKLPLPPLETTCDRYLSCVKPLLSEKDYENTRQLVEDFKKKDGPVLQQYLQNRQKTLRSWLADWWLTEAYLRQRQSIAINVNFFMSGGLLPETTTNDVARSANIAHATIEYHDMIQKGTLPPDMVLDLIPVCMDGALYMFGSCRIPGEKIDTIEMAPKTTHIVVVCNWIYFRVEMFLPDRWGHLRPITKHEIQRQLLLIKDITSGATEVNAVAALTAEDRTTWAKNRQKLLKSSVNAATLKEIQEAIFLLYLGYNPPENPSALAKVALTGDGTSRWFDKGMVLQAFHGTTMGISNMEHSAADATHYALLWEHCMMMEVYAPDGDLRPEPNKKHRELPPPRRLDWEFDEEMKTIIDKAYNSYTKCIDNTDVVMAYSKYGRAWMKKNKVSPDGYLQMAIQLCFYRKHQCFSKVYEPASSRLFDLGRTDNISPVTSESVEWVKMMDSSSATREQKTVALRRAIDVQTRDRLTATAGYGCDRHMLGLSLAAKKLNIPTPSIFQDKAFNLPMRLSTSQVPTQLGHRGLAIIPESIGGGFGPACHDGYGVLYFSMGDHMYNFNISSWHSCPETDSTEFGEGLSNALSDMKALFEDRNAF